MNTSNPTNPSNQKALCPLLHAFQQIEVGGLRLEVEGQDNELFVLPQTSSEAILKPQTILRSALCFNLVGE